MYGQFILTDTDTETDTENDTADVKIPYCSRPREVKGLQSIPQFREIFGLDVGVGFG